MGENSFNKAIFEFDMACKEIVHDFFYEYSLIENYKFMNFNESDNTDKEEFEKQSSNKFVEMITKLADKIAELIGKTIEGISKIFINNGSDHITAEDLAKYGIGDIIMDENINDIMRETKVQCSAGRKIIKGIAKTGIADEEEVNMYLNKAASFVNNTEGRTKVRAGLAASIYAYNLDMKKDAKEDIEYFNELKKKQIPLKKKAMLGITKVFQGMNKYRAKQCAASNMFFKKYNQLEKENRKRR